MSTANVLDGTLRKLCLALRMLRLNAAFSLTVILTARRRNGTPRSRADDGELGVRLRGGDIDSIRTDVGIRMALGAAPRNVQRMFVYRGMALSAVGIALGTAAAALLTRWLSSLLFGVEPVDVFTFVAAAAFLALAALLASYIPARRAAAAPAAETLRG